MRKLFLICATILLLAISEKVFAASLHEHPSVAVLPYTNKATVSIKRETWDSEQKANAPEFLLQNASLVTDMVIEQLLDTNRFRFVERENLQDVINELAYSQGGMVDSATVLRAGKQLGAQFLIAGSISGLSAKPSGADISVIKGSADFNKMSVVANVTIRFIDVETGEIVLAASGTGESARTNSEFSLGSQNDILNPQIKVAIGGQDYSLVQVRNALYKAVGDMIYNEKFGVIAKLDGKNKRRKV